jgi:hypothetical protein
MNPWFARVNIIANRYRTMSILCAKWSRPFSVAQSPMMENPTMPTKKQAAPTHAHHSLAPGL